MTMELYRRFYVNPRIRIDLHKDGEAILYHKSKEMKRVKVSQMHKTAVLKAFEDELNFLTSGLPFLLRRNENVRTGT